MSELKDEEVKKMMDFIKMDDFDFFSEVSGECFFRRDQGIFKRISGISRASQEIKCKKKL